MTDAVSISLYQSMADFISGGAGGVACVVSGQPFDTVKVKMQTYPAHYRNSFHCLRQTIRDERLRGLYSGTIPAIVSSVGENTVLFCCYGLCQSAICQLRGLADSQQLGMLEAGLAGSCASFFSSLVLCPTELVKCRMQAMHQVLRQQKRATATRPSSMSIIRDIMKKNGALGLFQGQTSTWAREMPGYFFFFGGYELSRSFLTPPGKTKDDIGAMGLMLSGGFGGACLWTAIYPIDVIKSRIQVMSMLNKTEGFTITFFNILRNEGIRALYSGIGPCVLRSFPANGTLFLAYEWTRKWLLGFVQHSEEK